MYLEEALFVIMKSSDLCFLKKNYRISLCMKRIY